MHRRKWEKANPVGEPVSEDEAAELVALVPLARPPGADPDPRERTRRPTPAARLGGPVWFADDEQWPTGGDGRKLEFVAQLDFARLPPLDGFPTAGVAALLHRPQRHLRR